MIDKDTLVSHTNRLLQLASIRGTNQGVKVYETMLERLRNAATQEEVDDCADRLKHALAGIEAHGHFTQEEFKIVEAVRELR